MAKDEKKEITIKGIAASPGVVHGPSFTFLQKELEVPTYEISEKDLTISLSSSSILILDKKLSSLS